MRVIKSFAENCTDYFKDKHSKLLLNSLSEKESILLEKLSNGSNERSIVKSLYGKSDISNSAYQNLKTRLRPKIEDVIILSMEGTEFQIIRKKILKKSLLVKTLDLYGHRDDMVDSAIDCLKDAELYQFYEIAFDMSRLLMLHYGIYESDIHVSESYEKKARYYLKCIKKEFESEKKFRTAISLLNSNPGFDENIADSIKNLCDGLSLENASHKIHYFYYYMKIAEYQARNDIHSMIDIARQSIDYFRSLAINHTHGINFFSRILVQFYQLEGSAYSLGMADTLTRSLIESNKYQHEKEALKFTLAKIKCSLNDYTGAKEIFSKINYKSLNQKKKEIFFLNQYFIHLICNDFNTISLHRLKTNLPSAKEDKSGIGLFLLIAECLYYVLQGKQYIIEDQHTKIENYIDSHLKNRDMESNFLRFLSGQSVFDGGKSSIPELEIIPLTKFVQVIKTKQLV